MELFQFRQLYLLRFPAVAGPFAKKVRDELYRTLSCWLTGQQINTLDLAVPGEMPLIRPTA